MAYQVTLEEADGHLNELIRKAQSGQDIILLQGQRPVARLVSLPSEDVSSAEIAQLAMAGGAFDWLANEPDIYDDEPAARVQALLKQWQQDYGLPTRPDGQAHTSVQDLLAQWDQEDSRLTQEEATAEQHLWEDHQNNQQPVSL